VTPAMAKRIEHATNGAVSREKLCPDIFDKLSGPCTPSAGDTSGRAAGSSLHPTRDTDRLPAAAPNSDEGAGV
jgi:DNA-binding transcriptional regulator YdaS (Cro superfamily)